MTASAFGTSPRFSIYTGRATNWPVVATSALLLIPFVLLGKGSGTTWWDLAAPAGALAVVVALCALTGSSVRTTAGPNGVTVHFGVLGRPRCHYPLSRIVRAEVIDLAPWFVSFGFWWTPRRTCCTVRSGPTLRLVLDDGRTVTVTTPDPAAAVATVTEARNGSR